MLQELGISSSQASFFFFGMNSPFFFSQPFQVNTALEGLKGVTAKMGAPIGVLMHNRYHSCPPSQQHTTDMGGRALDPFPPHRIAINLPPPRAPGLTDYIYHTCSSQGNGLNFIQYTPSGSAFKTHPQAHFSLSPAPPQRAAICTLETNPKKLF